MVRKSNIRGCVKNIKLSIPSSWINGKLMKNNVFAGVASPIKFSVWRVSILNFANLNAEKIVMINPAYDNISGKPCASKFDLSIIYTNTPGNSPKLTISTISWLGNREFYR